VNTGNVINSGPGNTAQVGGISARNGQVGNGTQSTTINNGNLSNLGKYSTIQVGGARARNGSISGKEVYTYNAKDITNKGDGVIVHVGGVSNQKPTATPDDEEKED
jgi:hypothetical protein